MPLLGRIGIAGALLLTTLSVAAEAQRGAARSVYTALDLDRCARVGGNDEEESAEWRCPGFGGVPLFVLMGDGRFDLDAGADNQVWESQAGFNNPPVRVEWRLRGVRLRAIIYRLRLTGDGNDGRSVLGVETIGGEGRGAGCLVAWIHGDVADANAVARDRADRDHRGFRCGHDEPEEVTRPRP